MMTEVGYPVWLAVLHVIAALALIVWSGLLRTIAGSSILVIQSIPVLMILFMSYYGLTLMGLEIPPLLAASASLAIYVSAYLAEIWRGAIQAVPYQQWEASSSLAMSRAQQYRHIILPQALRISLI